MEGITAPPLTSAEPGRLVQVKVRNGFLSTHSDSTETVPLIFARPVDLPLASSASPSRLLMETHGKTATNTAAISATATAKASAFTRKDGGFQAVAHDVPSGPNPESN
ncbi:hypothetical protein ACET3Z_025280 [Daucus carota]